MAKAIGAGHTQHPAGIACASVRQSLAQMTRASHSANNVVKLSLLNQLTKCLLRAGYHSYSTTQTLHLMCMD